jgi:septal ring factor EnvC (AmiA/AmiB activator)
MKANYYHNMGTKNQNWILIFWTLTPLILLLIAWPIDSLPQQPTPKHDAGAELNKALAESKALAEQIKTETEVKVRLTKQLGESEQDNTVLKQKNAELLDLLRGKDKSIEELNSRLNWVMWKVRKNNRRFMCRVLHDGCIKLR